MEKLVTIIDKNPEDYCVSDDLSYIEIKKLPEETTLKLMEASAIPEEVKVSSVFYFIQEFVVGKRSYYFGFKRQDLELIDDINIFGVPLSKMRQFLIKEFQKRLGYINE